ncbi:hypothetical protein [Hymenobacter sp. B81]|uniref:hypothetical protein n=1 Tax=Hymenobacter sp. B81 TaxID=3344878 RepID=UPI0037DC8360
MKTSLFAPLAALALLTAGCNHRKCDEPMPCVAGTVLAQTCMAGTLIQLHGAQGGQTVVLDRDGSGPREYHHVISTYTELGELSQPGQTLHFTFQRGGRNPDLRCLANDAPSDLPLHTLRNVSANSCTDGAAN